MTQTPFAVLVVDDETIVLSLVRDTLEEEGYAVVTTPNPLEAVTELGNRPFDLLITDIRMPNMDGIELAAKARELQPEIGVIFMTGYANLNSAKNAIRQGAFDYIMKPFELAEMRQAVTNAMKARADQRAKSPAEQLSHLSDLSSMLVSSNDRESVMAATLRYSLLHFHSQRGGLLFWDTIKSQCLKIEIDHDQITHEIFPDSPFVDLFRPGDGTQTRRPMVIGSSSPHPYAHDPLNNEFRKYGFPIWSREAARLIFAPIGGSAQFLGWVVIEAIGSHAESLADLDTKFLSITAGQLAVTLENISLLEQTQQAYSELKELQDQTIELEKMATRGQASAEIGHELNNFLGVVTGNLSLLEHQIKKGKFDDLSRYLSAMTDTIEKIRTFTGSLMDLRQISSRREIFAFDRILSEVIEYLRPQRRFQGVNIRITSLQPDLALNGDVTQIQQLLYNLFNNAADATVDSARREITVETAATGESDRFTFSIGDTGSGFPPELLAKAFQEKFTTKKTGHGFGLVVCKRIIENHGGKLQVDSTPGSGSRITITFPLSVAASEPVLA